MRARERLFPASNDRLRRSHELAQRGRDRLSGQWSFGERYLSGNAKLAVCRVDGGPRYYGAVLEARPLSGELKALPKSERVRDELGRQELDSNKPLVLPHDIEMVEWKDKIVPSVVRFQAFDDLDVPGSQPLFSFLRASRINELGKRIIDGKVALSVWRLAVPDSDCRGENIKACSGAVDDRTDMGVESGRQWPVDFELEELLSNLRARLLDQQVCWRIAPGFEFLLNHWDLGSSPVDCAVGV